jgi:hypothetical protein
MSAVSRVSLSDENHLPNALFLPGSATGTGLVVLWQQGSIDPLHRETHMNTLSSKLTAFAAALAMNSLIMGAVGLLFELQSHPHLVSLASAAATHQWLI